jgi:hypothetical protein
MPPPLSRLPWELAQEEFGTQGADFIASLGRLVLAHTKDLIRLQVGGIAEESQKEGPTSAKDQRSPYSGGAIDESPQVAPGRPKDEIRHRPG